MLTHLNKKNLPQMVDVTEKETTKRFARAQTIISVPEEVLSELDGNELYSKKGPVFQTAILAGVMAVKKTGDLIPLCHPIAIEGCDIQIHVNEANRIVVVCEVSTSYKTGVEMEALTGSSIAALTIYDMCKSLTHEITIEQTRLLLKRGGKSDYVYHEA